VRTCGCAVFHAWGCLQVAISGFAAWNLFAVRCAAPRRCHPSRCRRDCGGVRLCGPQSLRRDLSADFWRNAVGNAAERDYPVSLGARHICRAEPDARKQASKSVTLAAVLTEPLLAAIDGERTITEICREQSNRSLARAFFLQLWRWDQVVFDTSRVPVQCVSHTCRGRGT
jgi:hypothetical protein